MGELIEQLQLSEFHKKSLRSRWLDQVIWADKKAAQCRRWHYRLRLTTIIGGVILPALVGINFQVNKDNPFFQNWFPYIPFALSQIIAVSAAIEEFCRFGDRWRDYRQMAENLKAEGWLYLQSSGPYDRSKTHLQSYPLFASRVESIIKNDVQNYISDLLKQQTKEDQEIEKYVESAQAISKDKSLFASPEPTYRPPSSFPGSSPPSSYPAAPGYPTPNYPAGINNSAQADSQFDNMATLLSPTGAPTPPTDAIAASPQSLLSNPVSAGTLKTLRNTEFKLSTQSSQTLPDSQKVPITSGTSLGVLAYKSAENNHLRVTFDRGLGAENRNTWFVYAPHVELIGNNGQPIAIATPSSTATIADPSGAIRLPVPYFSQRDN